jgi:streptomycin 3"-adenylyltransferase
MLDSLVDDIRWARERLRERPAYAVLNCCRTLAFARECLILSKAEGARWGLQKLPGQFHGVIEKAAAAYGSEGDYRLEPGPVESFVQWTAGELEID